MDHKHLIAFAAGLAVGYLVLPMVIGMLKGAKQG